METKTRIYWFTVTLMHLLYYFTTKTAISNYSYYCYYLASPTSAALTPAYYCT